MRNINALNTCLTSKQVLFQIDRQDSHSKFDSVLKL
jgi:hypothetical protein